MLVLVLKLKILDLKLSFYPCFTSVFSKSVQQFQKLVQPKLKPVQPVSVLFPSVTVWPASLPVSHVRKSRVQIFGKPVQPNFGPAQPNLKPVQPNFWPGSTGFATGSTEFWPGSTEFAAGPVSGWVRQWTENPVVESGSTGFRTGSTIFQSDFPNSHQLLGAPLYTPPTLFPKKSTHKTPFLTWETPPTLSHTPLASPISNLWREIFEWVWELHFLCFISKSLLLFFIRALVLHRLLCGFITLGASSS
jgi:hypothetical protein